MENPRLTFATPSLLAGLLPRRPWLGAAAAPRGRHSGRPAAQQQVRQREQPVRLHHRDLGDLEQNEHAGEDPQVPHEPGEQAHAHGVQRDQHEREGKQQRGRLTDELQSEDSARVREVMGLLVGLVARGHEVVGLGRDQGLIGDSRDGGDRSAHDRDDPQVRLILGISRTRAVEQEHQPRCHRVLCVDGCAAAFDKGRHV